MEQASGHRFPAERRHMLKDEERKKWLPPEPILQAAGVRSGDVAVDIGAGTGFWTLPLTRLVGETGRVYAVDVEPIMLDELESMVREQALVNVEVVGSEELRIPLPDRVADIGVAGFVLHEPGDRSAFVRETARLLRAGGSLLVVDWQKRPTEKGPPVEHRLAKEEAEDLLCNAGLDVEQMVAPNADVYILLGRMPRPATTL